MENVIIKTAKAYGLFLLLVGLPYFLNVNVAIAFQEGFSSKNLTVEETFENGDAWTGDSYAYQQFAEDHSFKVVKDPVFDGDYIGKFELQYGDPMVTKNGGPRSEVLFGEAESSEMWYSFAVYFPSYGWKTDNDDEIISQWHASNGTPPLSLRVKNGKLRLRVGRTEGTSVKFTYLEFGDVPKDEWNEFVFHVVHSKDSDGLVEVWKNGEKFATHKGPNLYSDGKHTRWKIGIYKSTWGKKSTDINLRVTYFDNVRIGGENASLNDMITSTKSTYTPIPVTGISSTPNEITLQKDDKIKISANISPADADNKNVSWSSSNTSVATVNSAGEVTAVKAGDAVITVKTEDGNFSSKTSVTVSDDAQQLSIGSFALVDASTNNNIQTLSDGDQLDYDKFKDMSLNFRAITSPTVLGSVSISLSGPVSSARTDNGSSYDLLNKEGLQLSPGKYLLQATPYSERDKGGVEGKELAIEFELVEEVKLAIPASPTPISPDNGSNGVVSKVSLQWSAPENTEEFEIQVSEDKDFSEKHVVLEGVSSDHTEVDELSAGKTYFWRVKAMNNSGASDFSEPWSFLTNKEVVAVTALDLDYSTLQLEQDSTSILKATVFPTNADNKKLFWATSDASIANVDENGKVTAVGEGTASIIAKSEDGGFTAETKVTVSAKEAELSVQSFVMVDASTNKELGEISEGDQLEFSEIEGLSVNFRALTSPETIGSVSFSLEGPVSSSRTDNGFAYELLSNKGLRLLEGDYKLSATPYTVREKGGDKGSTHTISFSIVAPKPVIPEAPQMISPSNESVEIPKEVVLTWGKVDLAKTYELQVATDSTFTESVISEQGIEGTEWAKSGLEEGTAYFWRVRSTGEAGQSTWSEVCSFETLLPVPEVISVTGLEINSSTLQLEIDSTSILKASISPVNADNKKVFWATSDASIANIDENGKVTAVGEGTASIIAKTEDGGFTAETKVTVSAKEVELSVQSFVMVDASTNKELGKISDGDQLELSEIEGLSVNFRALTSPETIGSVSFSLEGPVSSSRTDNGFAYELLSNKGLSLLEGDYKLSATPYTVREKGGDKGSTHTISFSIVAPKPVIPEAPQMISPSNESVEIPKEVVLTWGKVDLAKTYELQVATDSTFTESVISEQGIEGTEWAKSGLEEGTAYFWRVRSTGEAGQSTWSEVCSFETLLPVPEVISVTGLEINSSTLQLEIDSTSILKASISPVNADNKKVFWATSDASIANIDENGKVTAVGEGTASIIAKTEDGGFTAETKVTVSAKEVELSVQSFVMVDASTNKELGKISDGDQLELSEIEGLSVNFRALTSPETIGSVSFSLEGPVSSSRTDNGFAYELLSNKGLSLLEGDYKLSATPYTVREKGGDKGSTHTISFSIVAPKPVIPEAPQMISPSNESVEIPKEVVLTWGKVDLAKTYELQVATDSTFTESVISEQGIEGTEWAKSGLEEGTAYFWRVRSTVDAGQSNWSEAWSFHTESIPVDEPTEATMKIAITLEVGNKLSLSTLVSEDASMEQSINWSSSNEEIVSVNSVGKIVALKPGEAYVTAKNLDTGVSSSIKIDVADVTTSLEIKNIQMIDLGTDKAIHTITDGEVININQASKLDLNFRATISSMEVKSVFFVLSGPIYSSRTDNGAEFELLYKEGLNLPAGNYSLTAIPYSEKNNGGQKGEVLNVQFTISGENLRLANTSPNLISPINTDTVSQNAIQFLWIDETSADLYELEISKNADFSGSDLIKSEAIKTNQFELVGLENGTEYFWRVRAQNGGVWGEYSSVWTFQTTGELNTDLKNALMEETQVVEPTKLNEVSEVLVNFRSGEKELTVSMFPNPSQDIVNLKLGNVSDDMVQVSLSDLNGNTLFSNVLENYDGMTTLNLSSIKPGIYLISVLADRQRKVMKLVKN
ncbi:Ig-like domain-containing protein [Cyclobacterium marinum]|uniref:Ig-like domain-containing protein n=1 Tax=Cyclobacterium marinum TaxID=104 RepID=UPI0018DB54AE|nr:Ig-like domain-containing protein [Cyclobacterium marinum]MBI0399169.1 Ig-like domain-containing protein [Cyclobacterium marinum]